MVALRTTNLLTQYMLVILITHKTILIHPSPTPMHILALTRTAVKVYPEQELIPQGTVSIRDLIKVLAAAE
jgi:hypothetical protein